MKLGAVGIIGLAGLAVIQGLFLYQRERGPELGSSWIQAGDSVGEIHALTAAGESTSLATGDTLLLLSFHSECGHCKSVIPFWREMEKGVTSRWKVVAISGEPQETAAAYLASFHWRPDVWEVSEDDGPVGRRSLVTRTPWAFVLDGDGVVLGEAHGRLAPDLVAKWFGGSRARAGHS